jgi:hypothetical protein
VEAAVVTAAESLDDVGREAAEGIEDGVEAGLVPGLALGDDLDGVLLAGLDDLAGGKADDGQKEEGEQGAAG